MSIRHSIIMHSMMHNILYIMIWVYDGGGGGGGVGNFFKTSDWSEL